MYDTTIGHWITEDPTRFGAGDPNLRRFVHNDPTNAVDPTGLELVAETQWEAQDYLAWLTGKDDPKWGQPSMMLAKYKDMSPKLTGVSIKKASTGRWVFV